MTIGGVGTAETSWQAWTGLGDWPVVAAADLTPLVVVAAHPDDEVLGVGGLMASVARVDLVAVTDGEASHPHADVATRAAMARRRPVEAEQALRMLGATVRTIRLRQPDGDIDETGLTAELAALLTPDHHCVATWRADGHPDREAVGRAAAAACIATGARLWEYPIWMWHWATPADPRVPWQRCRRIDLPPDSTAATQAAIGAFASRTADIAGVTILPPEVLERFRRPFEVLFG